MNDDQLIASSDPARRANPMIWEGEEPAQGVFLGTDDSLALLGTPALEPAAAPRLPEDFAPGDTLRAWLASLETRLAAAARGVVSEPLDAGVLDATSRLAVEEILGEGEVAGSVSLDGVDYQLQESVLPGVWRSSGSDGSFHVEVATLPGTVLEAAHSLETAPFEVPPPSPGLMNAPAVLAEISDRAARWEPGQQTHVVNFTLLPMSEADQGAVREVLGRAALELQSGGFGTCRVYATRYRHVWAVQYLNALGNTILDTVEIGAPPAAIAAARQDFEDSLRRYADILEIYLR